MTPDYATLPDELAEAEILHRVPSLRLRLHA